MRIISQNKLMGILLCITAVHLTFMGVAQSVPVTLSEPLSMAMQATGAETDTVYMSGRAKIELENVDQAKLNEVLQQAATRLSIEKTQYVIEEHQSDYQRSAEMSVNIGKRQIVLIAKQLWKEPQEENKVDLAIYIVEKTPDETRIVNNRDAIDQVMQKFNVSPIITTCLEGYLDGKLRKGEWEFCLRDAFDAIGAEIITTTCNEYYASYAGFSPLVKEQVRAGKDMVNVNMAMRYNAFNQRTYVIIASPIINIAY